MVYKTARSRRHVVQCNLALCLPELGAAEREALARAQFGFVARSLLERGILWFASEARLRRLIQVEGDVGLADRSDRPVMWLAPHFAGLEQAGMASRLYGERPAVNIYQVQSNPVFNAALLRGRGRFGKALMFSRHDSVMPVVRAIRRGAPFFNPPDMDFGLKDAAFVPFFGVPAATLLAPARMARSLNMLVQPVVVQMLPGGQGYKVRFLPPWHDFPGADDDLAATARINRWIEDEIRTMPAQYLWVHRRFKTRPEGEPPVY
ncbi:MAG: lipid A biosynthesis acyltransferase [Burkholderiales bacterium PBB5]|nr:MAG: lipid A biosynthesis acyltransferase [Burkholderiales bacterium PBB5]